MASTQYQILYRYTNPNSNQLITNEANSDYAPVFELYHDKHSIEVGTPEEKLAANNQKSDLIINGNNTSIDNYNMLYKFTGTKRKNKKIWKPKSTGYVIRDKMAIKDLVTDAVNKGDYNGDYLLIEGTTVENGIVIAKKNPVSDPIYVVRDDSLADVSDYYTEKYLYNLIVQSTIAKLNTGTCDEHGAPSYSSSQYMSFQLGSRKVYTGPVALGVQRTNVIYGTSSIYGSLLEEGLYSSMRILPTHVQTYEIPAHFEDVAEYPYVVCDTYEKIEQSPWFILSSHASLTSALEKAKMIIKAVGVENVKMIKVVPNEQFVKIK